MAAPTGDPLGFKVINEIGIIEQLASSKLEKSLPDGLKVSQFTVLNHLVRLGGDWSPLRLANAMQVTKGAMTNTVQRLEDRGLVEVLDDPSDGRKKIVRLTPAGAKMRERCIASVTPALQDLSAAIPASDFETVLPILQKIRVHLDENR